MKNRVEQVDLLKARLLNEHVQTDVEGVKKLANEYQIMFEDVHKRLKTLKKLFQKPTQSKKSVRKVCRKFFLK